eukprot:TRINITY_DN321_c4_g1_i1.p1 TRINITY_DN321_c4_g1~~TRINITY_DN321_c4_g1_i1.p1  ORF type:complete len:318 (+),score=104.48 TRINITY_DN321_c4_g1_i1:175-1128(+)
MLCGNRQVYHPQPQQPMPPPPPAPVVSPEVAQAQLELRRCLTESGAHGVTCSKAMAEVERYMAGLWTQQQQHQLGIETRFVVIREEVDRRELQLLEEHAFQTLEQAFHVRCSEVDIQTFLNNAAVAQGEAYALLADTPSGEAPGFAKSCAAVSRTLLLPPPWSPHEEIRRYQVEVAQPNAEGLQDLRRLLNSFEVKHSVKPKIRYHNIAGLTTVYAITVEGSGRAVEEGAAVRFHIRGVYGETVVCDTWSSGEEIAVDPYTLNWHTSIGLATGVTGMHVGEERMIYMPFAESGKLQECVQEAYDTPFIVHVRVLSVW